LVTAPAASVAGPPIGEALRARYRSDHHRGRSLAELCRLRIARVPMVVFAAGTVGSAASVAQLVAGVVLIAAACAAAAALNDRADVASDRRNGRTDRPLVSGALDPYDVTSVVRGAALVALVAQAGLPQPTGMVVTAGAAVVGLASAVEPVALQRRGLVGLITLAIGYLVLPIGLAAGLGAAAGALPLALLGAGVLAHKDVRDEAGDRAAGKRTLLVQVGHRRMTAVAAVTSAAGLVGLAVALGAGVWIAPAVWVVGELTMMAIRGHSTRGWRRARLALVVAAVVIGVGIG
jgi:4-hydroxybenzoate polyprenyltransferase